jgi:hypothetical protein
MIIKLKVSYTVVAMVLLKGSEKSILRRHICTSTVPVGTLQMSCTIMMVVPNLSQIRLSAKLL